MESLPSHRGGRTYASALEGSGTFRAQQAESSLARLGRGEWWLWLCAFFVTALSALAFLLSSIPSFF
jgi:hypothetical protein